MSETIDLVTDLRRIAESGNLPEWAFDNRANAASIIRDFCYCCVKRVEAPEKSLMEQLFGLKE